MPTADEILKLILGGAGALVIMVVAIWWLNRDRDKTLTLLKEERDGRLKAIEDSNTRCAADRLVLHEEVNSLQKEVRKLFELMLRASPSARDRP